MGLRRNSLKIFKEKDRISDIEPRKVGVLMNLHVISRVISQLSIRKATDPDAEEFMRKQFIYALSGGRDSQHIVAQGTKIEVRSDLEPDVLEMMKDYNKMKEDFLLSPTPDETHLGIIDAAEVGCHHPKLPSIATPSALSLHGKSGLCQICPREYHSTTHLSRGVMNPFRCWRRGHRSGEFGFIYRITLGLENRKWKIMSNVGEANHQVFASNNFLAGLQYEKNRDRFEKPVPSFHPLEDSLSRQMMVSIHINSDAEIILDEIDEIKTLLPSQLLVSRHIDLKESIKQDGDFENLPTQLKELILLIHETWTTIAPSTDSQGIIGLAIVQQGCDEIADIIRPHLRELPFSNFLEDDCDFDSLNPESLKDLIIHNSGNKAKLAICIKLDPIMDIGGALHRL